MSDQELISVIIPVYNGVRFLNEAVQSVRSQGEASIEIIVMDDGSTDGSYDLACSLPDVRCFRQANAGAAAARNAAIDKSRGSLLSFLDADDLWTADKLPLQLKVLHEMPSMNLIGGGLEEFHDPSANQAHARPARLLRGEGYSLGTLLVRRGDFLKVGYFDPQLKFGEFIDWRSRALASGMREHVLSTILLRRRIHDENMTGDRAQVRGDYLAVVKAHIAHTRGRDRK